jgi:hypothetical protein
VALAKVLIVVGLLLAAAGVLLWWGVPIGRLPGDIVVRRGAFTFYLPVTTSIIASIVLTVVMALLRR